MLSGHGDGTFTAALEVDSGPSPYANAIADIDRDGKLDLLFADQDGDFDGGKVTILRNSGEPAALAGPAGGVEFGDQAQQTVGLPKAVTVTNEGSALLRVDGATLAGTRPLAISSLRPRTARLPPVRPGRSCTIAVPIFRPRDPRSPHRGPADPQRLAARAGGDRPCRERHRSAAEPRGARGRRGAGASRPRAPLVLALAQKQLLASVGKRFQVRFVTTLPGEATLTASPGGLTAKRSLARPGASALSLKIRKEGRYKLRLRFRAGDGQQREVVAKLTVAP